MIAAITHAFRQARGALNVIAAQMRCIAMQGLTAGVPSYERQTLTAGRPGRKSAAMMTFAHTVFFRRRAAQAPARDRV
jgi:hypothetical protein